MKRWLSPLRGWVTLSTNLKNLMKLSLQQKKLKRRLQKLYKLGRTLLPGTGEQVWKMLFDAARKYSTETAYTKHEFPHTSEEAVCLLCQQPLDESTRQRLKRFEQYVKDNVAKTVNEQRIKLEEAKTKIKDVDLRIGLDTTISEEIKLLDESLIPIISAFEASLKDRRESMFTSLSFSLMIGPQSANYPRIPANRFAYSQRDSCEHQEHLPVRRTKKRKKD